MSRVPALAALCVSAALGVGAWTWRTGAVGGSDSSCYAVQARAFSEGRWQPASALALDAPWPEPTRVAAPGGFLPSTTRPGAAVPICAPGYSALVAPLVVTGRSAIHVVPALAAACLAWVAFLLGSRVGSPWAGLSASILVAGHPMVWFQAVQPMNDITTAALWVGAVTAAVTARVVWTGALVGLGLLVRPNLAPAAVAITVVCAWAASRTDPAARLTRFVRVVATVSLCAAPAIALVALLNTQLYGAPWRTGYGPLATMFAWANAPDNLARYGRAWLATSTPLVLIGLAAPWLVAPDRRWVAWSVVATGAALSALYVVYHSFPEWWYLRFLLPVVTLSLVMASVSLSALVDRFGGRLGPLLACGIAALTSLWTLQTPEAREAFGLRALEGRFAITANTVSTRLPPQSVAITVWPSGAIRFDTDVDIVMWDALDPSWLDRAVAWLQDHGRPPAIVIEGWEEDAFRRRFQGQVYGGLDWPPRVDIDRRVRVFVPEDREHYLRGTPVPTERVFVPARWRR